MNYPSSLIPDQPTVGGMNLEIFFLQPDQVSVFLESSFTDPDEERFNETTLFSLYTARQFANGKDAVGYHQLAQLLFSLDEHEPLPRVLEALAVLDNVKIVSPTSSGGRKGFTCEFRPNKRNFFKLHFHGFGVLGKGVDYYAPTSALALLAWLLQRRADDQRYQLALGFTATRLGGVALHGGFSLRNQSDVAVEVAGAAWMHPDDMIPDDVELSDEVKRLCKEHNLQFGLLYGELHSNLDELLATPEDEEAAHRRDLALTRLCRVMVANMAGLIPEDPDSPLQTSWRLVEAALETDEGVQIVLAYDYYDRLLGELINQTGLEPVVEALQATVPGAEVAHDPTPTDSPSTTGIEVSEQVRELCERHGLDFAALAAEAHRQIAEVSPETSPGEVLIMRKDVVQRMCRVLVLISSALMSDEMGAVLSTAASAETAAIETGDERMIEFATSYYDNELRTAVEEAGLDLVVEALEGMILTDDLDEAAR